LVCHVNVVVCPCSIACGFTARVAVGAGGGGGADGGVAFAAFLLQPANARTPAKIANNISVLLLGLVIENSPQVKSSEA